MTTTTIEWTEKTWNPIRGCSRVTDECQKCYAEKIAYRFSGPGLPFEGLVHRAGMWNGKIKLVPESLKDPLHWVRGHRIFVNSMSDLFHESVPFDYIDKVMAVMSVTTRHTYQVLTKRPDRMAQYFRRVQEEAENGRFPGWPDCINIREVFPEWIPWREGKRGGYDNCGPAWPLENVWFGISAGRQRFFDERWSLLAGEEFSGWKLFLSAEPLLEPLDISVALPNKLWDALPSWQGGELKWIICGGESGPGARPCALGWLKDIVRQCRAANVPVFVKQLGARPINREGVPCPHITQRKGNDMAEWPEELRVREFPKAPIDG